MKEKNTENRKRKSFTVLLGECAIIVFLGVYICRRLKKISAN